MIIWFEFCKNNFDWGIATADSLKLYVAKNKISEAQYKEITGIDYVV